MTTAHHHQTTTAGAIPDGSAIVTTVRNAALSRLEDAINRLSMADATDEDFLAAMDTEAGLKAIVREYSARLEEAAIDYIKERSSPGNPYSVETPTARFYVGDTKTTKCRDTARAVDAVLQACGGDFDTLLQCLSSQPLKHGACRAVLGEEWDRHFEVVEKADIKTGKPVKGVRKGLPQADGKGLVDGSDCEE